MSKYSTDIRKVTFRACLPWLGALAVWSIHIGAQAETRLVAQLASDWVYHGTTETFSQATAGFNAEWQIDRKLFLGIEGHQAVTPGVQQRHRAVMLYAGYSWSPAKGWLASATVARRLFPGSFKEWDYNELTLEFAHNNGLALKVDYAPDYYAHNTSAFIGELNYSSEISEHQYWYAQAGRAELGADRFSDYQYARLGTGLSLSRFNIDVSYGWNSADGQRQFGSELIRSPGLVIKLSRQVH